MPFLPEGAPTSLAVPKQPKSMNHYLLMLGNKIQQAASQEPDPQAQMQALKSLINLDDPPTTIQELIEMVEDSPQIFDRVQSMGISLPFQEVKGSEPASLEDLVRGLS